VHILIILTDQTLAHISDGLFVEFAAIQQLVRVIVICSYDLSQVAGRTKIFAKLFIF